MTNRINELARKAGGHQNYSSFRGHIFPPPPDYIDPSTVDLSKFAELIIQECIDVHEDSYGIDIIGKVLKKHFGLTR